MNPTINGPILTGIAISYFLGSIPTGYWFGKALKGIDIRQHGSGNSGATNVFRVVGKTAGILTLILDLLKGFLPVKFFLVQQPLAQWEPCLAGLAAIAGHNWSIFLSFRGGKGVATSTGVFLALLPIPAFIAIGVFIAGLAATRHVSVGSMLGAVSLSISTWWFTSSVFFTILTAGCGLLILFLHRNNMRRLIRGQEPKLSLESKGT